MKNLLNHYQNNIERSQEDLEIILRWLDQNELRNNKGQAIEFDDHRFLFDYLLDDAKRIVVQKCTQVGVSFITLLKTLFYGDSGNLSIIYTLPTAGDVKDFVRSKFDPIIMNSKLKEKVEKDELTRRAVYSSVLKRIGNSHFFFRSSWTEHSAQSIDADIVIFDELDFQKPEIRAMYEERLEGYSSRDIIYWIGCPTLPGYGINEIYEKSDQREWHIVCPHCGIVQTLTFPENISFKKVSFVCKICRKDLPTEARKQGKWIPKFPGREIHGYHFSRLMAPWVSAEKIIKAYYRHTPRHFHNFSLGLPYLEKSLQFNREDFEQLKILPEVLSSIRAEKTIWGIDQGSNFHVISGQAGPSGVVVTKAERYQNFQALESSLEANRPSLVLMDMFPDQHFAKKLQDRYGPDRFLLVNRRTYVDPQRLWRAIDYQRSKGIVNLEATESLDNLIDALRNKRIYFLSSMSNLEEVIYHIQNLVPDYQDRFGRKRKVYKKIGIDDYAHALNFFFTGFEILYPNAQQFPILIPSSTPPSNPIPGSKEWLDEDFERRTRQISTSEDTIIIPPKRI